MSEEPTPALRRLSVVIPSYNRVERLTRVLEALARQDYPDEFEIIVVVDGSTDGTIEYLRSGSVPANVRPIWQENGGPSRARNRGVQAASGDYILFIDDDVLPASSLLSEHMRLRHKPSDNLVIIGPMLSPDDAQYSAWVAWEQRMLYKQYQLMEEHHYEASFRQFYTGNVSLPRKALLEVGGFDERYRRLEDLELSSRLHQAGLTFVFNPNARGMHYAERSFESWKAVAHSYGHHDIDFARDGQLWRVPTLSLEFQERNVLLRSLVTSCLRFEFLGTVLAPALALLGRCLYKLRARRASAAALSALFSLIYSKGAARSLGSAKTLLHLLQNVPSEAEVDLLLHRRTVVAFVLEQTIGHKTYSTNLMNVVADDDRINPVFITIGWPHRLRGRSSRLPFYWTLKSGLVARRELRRHFRDKHPDVLFVHTQVPAVMLPDWIRKVPTIVSIDATPEQLDGLAEFYDHQPLPRWIEALKHRAYVRLFSRVRHFVTWSDWARHGLCTTYGVSPELVTTVIPGVNVAVWTRPGELTEARTVPHVLFVGGDFRRKGGPELMQAVAQLRSDPAVPEFVVTVVTRFTAEIAGATVIRDLNSNDQRLIDLYHDADIFCLPTLGDCLPMVLSEAASAGLAIVATDIGGIKEIVQHNENGFVVQPGSVDELADALRKLLCDSELRSRFQAHSVALASERFDLRNNTAKVVDELIAASTDRQSL